MAVGVSRPLTLTLLSHFHPSLSIHTFAPLSHYPTFAFYNFPSGGLSDSVDGGRGFLFAKQNVIYCS